MIDVPLETLHSQGERGLLHAQGRRTDDNTHHTLLIINETGGSWVIYGLGAPGVRLTMRLTKDVMVTLTEAILVRAG